MNDDVEAVELKLAEERFEEEEQEISYLEVNHFEKKFDFFTIFFFFLE